MSSDCQSQPAKAWKQMVPAEPRLRPLASIRVSMVTFEKTHYNTLPYKFEAGTPHIAGGIGLAAAIEYLTEIGLDAIAAYEHELLRYATDALTTVAGLAMIGTAKEKASGLSFVLDGVHPHDIGTILDRDGIAIRAGH